MTNVPIPMSTEQVAPVRRRPSRASTVNAIISCSLGGIALAMNLVILLIIFAYVVPTVNTYGGASEATSEGEKALEAVFVGVLMLIIGVIPVLLGLAGIITGAFAVRGRRIAGITGLVLGVAALLPATVLILVLIWLRITY